MSVPTISSLLIYFIVISFVFGVEEGLSSDGTLQFLVTPGNGCYSPASFSTPSTPRPKEKKTEIRMIKLPWSEQVFLVGKDFAPIVISVIAVLHPERLHGFVTLGAPFILPGLPSFQRDVYPKGFYIPRWQEPGRAEADFGRFDVKTVIRNIYNMFCWSELQIARDDQEIMDLIPPNIPLPPWFSEQDLSVYADLYEKSGFRTALQVPYRSLNNNIDVENPTVMVPALLIMGEKDYVLKFPGMEDYIRSGIVKKFVPNLEIVFVPEGNHFIQEQLPQEVNQLIISFLGTQTIQQI